jgi:hypothetical protein
VSLEDFDKQAQRMPPLTSGVLPSMPLLPSLGDPEAQIDALTTWVEFLTGQLRAAHKELDDLRARIELKRG